MLSMPNTSRGFPELGKWAESAERADLADISGSALRNKLVKGLAIVLDPAAHTRGLSPQLPRQRLEQRALARPRRPQQQRQPALCSHTDMLRCFTVINNDPDAYSSGTATNSGITCTEPPCLLSL